MRPHHRLQAWSKALELVTAVYQHTDRFPKDEKVGLTSQIKSLFISFRIHKDLQVNLKQS